MKQRSLDEIDGIEYENDYFYVKKKGKIYEIIKNGVVAGYVVGWSENLQTCIRTADRLAKYPHNV